MTLTQPENPVNPVTFRNMTASEQERYSYLSDLSCVETRGALADSEYLMKQARFDLESVVDKLVAMSTDKANRTRQYVDKILDQLADVRENLSND